MNRGQEIEQHVQKLLAGLKKISVVDDLQENRQAAAIALEKVFPTAEVLTYSSTAEIIIHLYSKPDIDLIFSDMKMEEQNSGFKVACAALAWQVPCVIVSGGIKSHSVDQVAVGGGFTSNIYGEKSDSRVWEKIITSVVEKEYRVNTVMKMLHYGKKDFPHYKYGRVCAAIACNGIN